MSEYQLLQSHNQCPDCLSMELQLIPVADTHNQFEVCLNFKFASQENQLFNGKIQLALRALKLELDLENIKLIETKEINSELICQVNNPLSRQPYWEIKHPPNTKYLEGTLTNVILAVVEIESTEYKLTAKLTSKLAHVYLSEIEGLWRHDITPNKHGVLERKLAKFMWQTKLNPYISQGVYSSQEDGVETMFSEEKELLTKAQERELKDILQLIYQTPSDVFSELASIAGLNIFTDFAGGNLTGANLSGLKLGGANLKYVNLRGADLTDIDLSEANLSYAKLNGADLTGAYLEGANLTYANLQSASLALANLIGADLTGANLTKTNLTSTTVSQAEIDKAVFLDR